MKHSLDLFEMAQDRNQWQVVVKKARNRIFKVLRAVKVKLLSSSSWARWRHYLPSCEYRV
jgi:hypothetical protein